MTRVRQPFEYYLSYYKWSIVGSYLKSGNADLSFLQWAPSNLQSNLLLRPFTSPLVESNAGRTPNARTLHQRL